MRGFKQTLRTICGLLAIILPIVLMPKVLAAPTYTSSSYGIDEVFMGAGSLNDAASASYEACMSAGSTTAGNSSSASYQTNSGPCTTADPYIKLTVAGGSQDLGYLSTDSATTTTGTFSVKAYLASGYEVVTGSDPPAYESNSLDTMSGEASVAGTEQFGINIVANTSPITFGANPVQVPSSSYSYGAAATGYNTANSYRYTKGDIIAYSDSSSGETDYTISYVFNISSSTVAGTYSFVHVIIATATY